jgi:flagellar biosynthesis/type III secretory pathway protein FliH
MKFDYSDHTPYDTRIKQVLANGIPVLLRLLLQLDSTDPLEWVTLPNEEPLTLHKRADFVMRNRNTNQLIQVEMQTHADTDLLERCFVYAAPYMVTYKTIPYQYILHLGKGRATYRTAYQNDWHTFRIEVIDMKAFSAEDFLQSDLPEAVVMAILCAAGSPDRLVEDIFNRLRTLVLDNNRLADYISIVDTLSELRDMNEIIKNKRKQMALQFDITKSSIFQEGREKGITEGIAEGIAKGKAEGKTEGRDETILEIVREMHADGDSIGKIARICHLTENQVREILGLAKA